MKPILSIVFSLLLFVGYAQDFFEKIKPGKTHWVYESTDSSNTLIQYGFFADSIKKHGGFNQIFFSKRLLYPDSIGVIDSYSEGKITGNIFGDYLIETQFSWSFISNEEDTIKIPKKLLLGDSALVYKIKKREVWIKRTASLLPLLNPFELKPDTLTKTFCFFEKGITDTLIQNQLKSLTLKINPNLGFTMTPDFYLLPELIRGNNRSPKEYKLIGSTVVGFGDTLPRTMDIFSFPEGTEFHFKTGCRDYFNGVDKYCHGTIKITLVGKSEKNDSLILNYSIQPTTNCGLGGQLKKKISLNSIFGKLPNQINSSLEVGPLRFEKTFGFHQVTDAIRPYRGVSPFVYYGYPYSSLYEKYAAGIGQTYFYESSADPGIFQNNKWFNLVHVKYKNTELGTPLSIIESKATKSPPYPYPNPTKGIINISNFESLNSIQVYNLQGKLVFETKIPNLKSIYRTFQPEFMLFI